MYRKLAAVSLAVIAGVLVACGGRGAGGNVVPPTYTLPGIEPDLVITSILPPRTIGENFPSKIGTVKSKHWGVRVGGYTQTHYSQILGFKPGTKITIFNMSKSASHTLNVIKQIFSAPAHFPKSPTLLTSSAHKGGKLEQGYRSGVIKPGKSITVTLTKGVYLIGCAFHYKSFHMRDVLVVKADATPGPEATKPAPSPTSSGGGGGGWSTGP